MNQYQGQCKCGNVKLTYESAVAAADIEPRACDCEFCTRHKVVSVSDAEGKLSVTVGKPNFYIVKQGSNTAEFMSCANCGQVGFITYKDGENTLAAVNANVLAEKDAFKPAVTVSPKELSTEEKIERWQTLWVPEVSVEAMS